MPEFDISHTNKMDWKEFGKIVENLIAKIKNDEISFDAIAPILRSGAIPATMIANKLEVIPFIPLQLKYNKSQNGVDTLIEPVISKNIKEITSPNILVIESNTNSGKSKNRAYNEIIKKIPNANLYYACITQAFVKKTVKTEYKKEYFGIKTDENFIADEKEKENLRYGITIFPWETPEFELNDINTFLKETHA